MAYKNLKLIIRSKISCLSQIEELIELLHSEIELNKRLGLSSLNSKVRKKYVRIANRLLKDLRFSEEDFLQDHELER